MRSRVTSLVGHHFRVIARGERDIPSNGGTKPVIVNSLCRCMPSKEHLDIYVGSPSEPLVKGRVVLNRVGYDNSEPGCAWDLQLKLTEVLAPQGGLTIVGSIAAQRPRLN